MMIRMMDVLNNLAEPAPRALQVCPTRSFFRFPHHHLLKHRRYGQPSTPRVSLGGNGVCAVEGEAYLYPINSKTSNNNCGGTAKWDSGIIWTMRRSTMGRSNELPKRGILQARTEQRLVRAVCGHCRSHPDQLTAGRRSCGDAGAHHHLQRRRAVADACFDLHHIRHPADEQGNHSNGGDSHPDAG